MRPAENEELRVPPQPGAQCRRFTADFTIARLCAPFEPEIRLAVQLILQMMSERLCRGIVTRASERTVASAPWSCPFKDDCVPLARIRTDLTLSCRKHLCTFCFRDHGPLAKGQEIVLILLRAALRTTPASLFDDATGAPPCEIRSRSANRGPSSRDKHWARAQPCTLRPTGDNRAHTSSHHGHTRVARLQKASFAGPARVSFRIRILGHGTGPTLGGERDAWEEKCSGHEGQVRSAPVPVLAHW